ncbi:MAG: preprotein translocase subunit SecG [Xanthobacteraceae bacterium]|jgi:preprotein translocase subunit SecG
MLTVVIAIHLMLVLALIGVVLLQKSEGGGLVGSSSGFMTGRGTANALSRATAVLAAGFFVTSLALSWIASYEHRPVSIINTSGPASPAPPGPAGGPPPAAPLSPGSGGLLNQLQKGIPSLPAGSNPNFAPEPSGPQVPQSK